MNAVDFFILIVLIIFIALGSKRGMIEEVLGLTGWIVAILIALRFMWKLGSMLSNFAKGKIPESILIILGFIIILVVIRLAFQATTGAFKKVFSQSIITNVDKIGGAVFGLIKGALVISVLVLAMAFVPFGEKIQQQKSGSLLFGYAEGFAPAVFNIVKKFLPQSQNAIEKLMDSIENAGTKTNSPAKETKPDQTDKSGRPKTSIQAKAGDQDGGRKFNSETNNKKSTIER